MKRIIGGLALIAVAGGGDGIGIVLWSVVDSGTERVVAVLLLMTAVAILIVNATVLLLLF